MSEQAQRRLTPPDGGLYASLTIDDVAAGDGRRFQELLDWLDQQEVAATFFLIPYSYANKAPIDEDKELMAGLARAAVAGHEFFPHGYDHDMFECGLPDLLAVRDEAMLRKIARALSREQSQLRHHHTRGTIGARLSHAVRIWEVAFDGTKPTGFRSGYHSFCRDFYFALEDIGIRWSSSRTATPGAWRDQVTDDADEVVPWLGLHPFWIGDVLEIPHLADYGADIAPERIGDWLDLARRHLAACRRAEAPFIYCAQQSGLRCNNSPKEWRDAGYRSHTELIKIARGEFGAQYALLSEIAEAALERPGDWLQRDEYRR